MKTNLCVDEASTYAIGFSNGNGFANTFACSPTHNDEFAAVAEVSSAPYTDIVGNNTCSPSRLLLPVLELHCGGDGRDGPLPSIDEWLRRWAERNSCVGQGRVEQLDSVLIMPLGIVWEVRV